MKKTHRGVALITVLLAVTVLAMLSSSLLLATRGNLITGEQFRRRQVLLKTAYSGLDYARARLAQVPNWSKSPFGSVTPLDDPHLRIVEQGASEDANSVSGEDKVNGSRFRVRVFNNLRGLSVVDTTEWSRSKVKIPRNSALVLVEAEYEGSQRRIEAVLVRGSLVTNSLSAGDSVAAKLAAGSAGDLMQFSSTLPRGNVVKAQNQVVFPNTQQIKFRGGNGSIQSGGDVSVNATVNFDSMGNFTISNAGTALQNNPTGTAAASSQMSANIRTGSPSNQNFSPDKLVQPVSGKKHLPPGTYTFIGADQVTYRNELGQPAATNLSGIVTVRDFRFIPMGDVDVAGNLTINGMVPRATWISVPANDPHYGTTEPEPTVISLGLGYDDRGIPKAAQDPKDRLTVAGNLKVVGDLTGNGQIIVNKNGGSGGNLEVMGNSFMSATRTDGMAVVAQGTAKFSEVQSGAASMPAYMVPNDLARFGQAILSEYANHPSRDVFNRFHASTTAERMNLLGIPGAHTGLRNQPAGSALPKPTTSYGGIPLQHLQLTLTPPGGGAALPISAKDLVSQYIDGQTLDPGGDRRPMSLGDYIRLREFLKSVDLGAPKPELLDPLHPLYGEGDALVTAAILNQVQAYDQDARNDGRQLDHYLTNLAGVNPYQSLQELIFGGLLYADGNLFTQINTSFNLYGAMIAKGNIGFDHLQKGKFVFDPTLLEEQFELSKLGLVPAFFWSE
ncbi:MAG: hypothetical protein J0I12_17595 [Candidatus Eremiobacteraeota bacterium]|nr:hypothetical protein [Candidatus Eremiobacteraeota bacterium]